MLLFSDFSPPERSPFVPASVSLSSREPDSPSPGPGPSGPQRLSPGAGGQLPRRVCWPVASGTDSFLMTATRLLTASHRATSLSPGSRGSNWQTCQRGSGVAGSLVLQGGCVA